METESSIARGLRVTDGESKYDEACKRLLSEKPILARIMKAVVPEYENCTVEDIAQKYIEGTPEISLASVHPDEPGADALDESPTIITGEDTEDKTVREGQVNYDIRFRAAIPYSAEKIGMSLIMNVEAQNDFYPGYSLTRRGVYYCCRMISSQYGREFTKSHYEKIKKVYSIWICMNPPEIRENTITSYCLTEKSIVGEFAESVGNYDLLSLVMICLNGTGKHEENYVGILRMLDVLLSETLKSDKKQQILQDEFDIPMTRTIEEGVSDMCNLSQGVLQKGIEKGMAQGIEKGIEKGRAEKQIENIRNLVKNMQWTIEQAMDALGIAPTERETYRELLKEQPS